MFKHKVEVKLSFVPTKEVNSKGNQVKVPVVHRTLYLTDGEEAITGVRQYKVVAFRRDGTMKFSVSYWPPLSRNAWWEEYRQIETGWKREREPNGKVTPAYDLEGILRWLKYRVADPVVVLTELLTTSAKRPEAAEAEGEAA